MCSTCPDYPLKAKDMKTKQEKINIIETFIDKVIAYINELDMRKAAKVGLCHIIKSTLKIDNDSIFNLIPHVKDVGFVNKIIESNPALRKSILLYVVKPGHENIIIPQSQYSIKEWYQIRIEALQNLKTYLIDEVEKGVL